MNKNTVYGFILGVVVVFALASVFLMPPQRMIDWIETAATPDEKVDRAINNPASTVKSLKVKLSQLEQQLADEQAAHLKNREQFKTSSEKLQFKIKKLIAQNKSGRQDLSQIMSHMEKEIDYLSNKLKAEPKKVTSVEGLAKQRIDLQNEISSLTNLLAETEEALVSASAKAEKVKKEQQQEQEKVEVEFAKRQAEEQVSSNRVTPPASGGGMYDTSLLLGERKLFRNQTQIFYGGKLSIDLRRVDVGSYCNVRIRSFINEDESTTVSLKKGEPVKVRMANEDFILHYAQSFERPIPTCVFNVYNM